MYDLIGKLEFGTGVDAVFPEGPCCNCGKKGALRILQQNTRRTAYMFIGGTEIIFELPLPFCTGCAPSAKRRPKNIVHRALGFLVAFAAAALLLIVADGFVQDNTFLARYLFPLSAVIAAMAIAFWISLARPKDRQTSYYQPVRIPILKRQFISGEVTAIGFRFSNKHYEAAFVRLNQEAIRNGRIIVQEH